MELCFFRAFFSSSLAESSPVQEVVLDNGLKVLLLEDHKSPAVTFQVWYRVGSRNEKDGKSGLSHFLEHMMFKGTSKISLDEFKRIIARQGGRSNAFTLQDTTVYFATMSRDKIEFCVSMEADRMVRARMDEEYFEAEKNIVMEERHLRTEDLPSSALSEAINAVAYTVHPYRRPVVGWMQDLENLSPEDLENYYRTYYAPEGPYQKKTSNRRATGFSQERGGTFFCPHGLPCTQSPQSGELRIGSAVGGPRRRTQFQAPPRSPLRSTPHSHSGRRLHRFRYRFYDLLDRGSGHARENPADVEHAIDELLAKIRTEPITERELQKAKNQVEASILFARIPPSAKS